MNGLGTGGGGTTHNTVSGDAVVVRPLLLAQRIEGIQLPPAPPDAPPNQGPPPGRVFVNRTKELTDLRDAARALAAGPEPRVLTVVGVGGVGKTQLVAQSVRRELMQLFPQGQLYVDLEDLRQDGVVAPAAGSDAGPETAPAAGSETEATGPCRSCDQTCADVVREWSPQRGEAARSGQKRA
ncbi:hypothetical protein [Streptomyces sp. CS090A]|uniref:hypothetical protein n=1 Tax=Streptomyces sp. CS090A TaxID=2162710 RepID=UPI001EF690C2|nr:hypothetical protein [Streptomyces sp. CS090A]